MGIADLGLQYSGKRRANASARDASLAQNSYSQFLSQQRGARETVSLNKRMDAGLQGFGASYGRRGLSQSGIFNQAQTEYGSNWLQGQQDINDQLAQAKMQNDFANSAAWNQYDQTEADIQAQINADILAAATALKSSTGG